MRAVAVLAVVLYHAHMPGAPGGFIGVDMFFVVSGFLITGQLVEELAATRRIHFGAFYARRARRILPAAFAVIVATVVAALAFQPPVLVPRTLRESAAAALYVPNLLLANDGTEYFAEKAPSPLQHYWSLGAEEQFYLAWPLLLLLAFTFLGRSRRGLLVALTSATALSLMLAMYMIPRHPVWAFFHLPTRAWEFGIGGLLVVAISTTPRWLDADTVGLLGWPGLALIVHSVVSSGSGSRGRLAFSVVGTALVILADTGSSRLSPRALLSATPLLFVGLISYSVYLVHWPVLVIAQEAVGLNRPLPTAVMLTLGASAIPLGWLVYLCVEKPCRYVQIRTARGSDPTLIVAAAVSVALAGASTMGIQAVRKQALDAGFTAKESPLERYPRGTSAVPTNMEPSLWAVGRGDDDANPNTNRCHLPTGQFVPKQCDLGANQQAPKVALFGDSHAGHFFPALASLAQAGDIRLESMTKGGCQSTGTVTGGSECAVWRNRVVSILNDSPPDIILLGNHSSVLSDWEQNLRATLDRLPKRSRIVVIADTPDMGSTPAICLSAHLHTADACNRPRQMALNVANREAERKLGIKVVDVTDYMCNRDNCPPIIGNLLVYWDGTHLTEPFSTALAPVLRAQLLS